MAAENFDKWYVRAVVYELGNDDDPRDPGGRTSDGITQREYDVYRRHKGKPTRDVWAIGTGCEKGDVEALAERREIFRSYWDRIKGDALPAGIDYVVADGSLNSGPSQSVKWLQRAIGMNQVDGEIGPATLAAANNQSDNDLVVVGICQRRLAFMQGLRTWSHFGKGWSARVANCQKIGTAWATGSVGPDPVAVKPLGGANKASPNDIKKPIITVDAAQIAQVSGGAGTAATETASQLQALPSSWSWVPYVVGGLTVLAILAGVVAKIAERRAERAKNAEATAEVDTDADLNAPSVPINDNVPATPEAVAS